jgi:hypothetical protein
MENKGDTNPAFSDYALLRKIEQASPAQPWQDELGPSPDPSAQGSGKGQEN